MSVIKRVVTLLRGSVREIGESVVDANATRIYEQEIVDARQSIVAARNDLTMVMAKEMQSARDIERLQQEAARYESMAVEALGKSQDALAEEVAARVAALEEEHAGQTKAHAAYALQVVKLKDLVRTAEQRIREHEREIGIAKTTESVYRATRSISENLGTGGSRLLNARESLERIKQRHEELADRMAAAEQLDSELGHSALDRKLREAGIGEQADRQRDAMARIRARAATRAAPAAE